MGCTGYLPAGHFSQAVRPSLARSPTAQVVQPVLLGSGAAVPAPQGTHWKSWVP